MRAAAPSALPILLALLVATPLGAEPAPTRIASVRVEGLRGTREEVVLQWVKVRPGDPIQRFDEVRLRADLLRLGIFSDVHVERRAAPKGVDLVIEPRERWSLYPVPMLVYYRDTYLLGGLLVESNALGRNKGWALGGVYSNRGWQLLGAVVDPNVAYTSWFAKLSVFGGAGLLENVDATGRIVQSFALSRIDAQYSVGRTFLDVFTPAWTGAVRAVRVERAIEGAVLPDETALSQGLALIYSDLDPRGHFDAGVRTAVEYQHGFPIADGSSAFDNLFSETRIGIPTLSDQALQFGIFWAYARFPPALETRLGGLDGSRTLPALLVPADKHASATASYQVPVLRGRWGVGSLSPFVETGVYRRDGDPANAYWGPGLGFQVFLRQVAMPAFGGDVAYQMGTGRFQFSVAIGYRPTR